MRYALLLALSFLSLACAVQTPTATVRGVSLAKVDAQGLTINLDLNVKNPNSFAIPLAKADYTATLAGVRSLTGSFVPSGTLVASGDTAITLPVGIRWDDLLATKAAIVKTGGDVPFSLNARLAPSGALAMLGDRATVNLDYAGTVPVKAALKDPQAFLSSPAALELAKALLTRWPF